MMAGGFAVLFPYESNVVRAPPTAGSLTVTFHDISPDTHTFPGDVNISMISLEMTASGGDAQVYSIDFTLSGIIHPSEISNVALWDDANGDKVQQSYECELARTPVMTSTFTVPRTGNLSECTGPANYVVNDSQTRYILVLISVNITAVPDNTIRLYVTAINADVTVNGGTGSTGAIEVNSIFFSDDMESGPNGWIKEGWDEGLMHTPGGLWHLSQGEEVCKNTILGQPFFHSYNTSWWYGHRYEDPSDPGTFLCNYYTHEPGDPYASTRNWGKLRTPWIDARKGTSLVVTVWHYLSKELGGFLDRARVYLNDSLGWHFIYEAKSTENQWSKLTFNLSDYAGKRMQLEFRFDEVDRHNNHFLGWFIDDLTIYGKYISTILPPTNLTTTVVGDDVLLEWNASISPGLDHYLIYRATDQREFDFSIPLYNTSNNPFPLRTNWTDIAAAEATSPAEYYYIVRAGSSFGLKSITSNTAGKWTSSFREGRDAFSLPLEPFVKKNVSWYSENLPGTEFIRWMNTTGHWVTHYPSIGEGVKDIPAVMGDSFEISLSSSTNFTFCGYPASMIRFQEGLGDSIVFRKSLSVQTQGNDVSLGWEPVVGAIEYLVFRSEERNGLHDLSSLPVANTTESHWIDSGVVGTGRSEYYYMVIPIDSSSGLGSGTYSVGMLTLEYHSGSDAFSLPLKPEVPHTLDWYCENIPNTVGIVHMMKGYWRLHAREMPEGVYDTEAVQGEGYQILSERTSSVYSFVGY